MNSIIFIHIFVIVLVSSKTLKGIMKLFQLFRYCNQARFVKRVHSQTLSGFGMITGVANKMATFCHSFEECNIFLLEKKTY